MSEATISGDLSHILVLAGTFDARRPTMKTPDSFPSGAPSTDSPLGFVSQDWHRIASRRLQLTVDVSSDDVQMVRSSRFSAVEGRLGSVCEIQVWHDNPECQFSSLARGEPRMRREPACDRCRSSLRRMRSRPCKAKKILELGQTRRVDA